MTVKHSASKQRIISAMTINLRFGLANDGENSWENRQHAYPALFKDNAPDFIGVQEANDFQTLFLDKLLDEYDFIGVREPAPKSWQDNLIFYRKPWRCLMNKHYFLSNTPSRESRLPESKWPRQCTIGLFENKGVQVIIVNTHFDFKASVQKKSSELIMDFLLDFPKDIPVIITGDFNAAQGSPAHSHFSANGFRDIFDGGHTSTYHGFTGQNLGDHIDWILCKGALKVIDRCVIRNKFSNVYPSDHFPVRATFEFETALKNKAPIA